MKTRDETAATDGAARLDALPARPLAMDVPAPASTALDAAIRAAQAYLLHAQHDEGYWSGELEGDTILESEYILLSQFLGRADPVRFRKLARHIRTWQHSEGYWPIFPGGPPDVSASVKAYFACKLAGHAADEPFMRAAREAIVARGGVKKCNTFTKLYLAIFGQYDWSGVPIIPPELILLPRWFYFNIYAMSSWSRAILVPLAVMNAMKPSRAVPPGCGIDELFAGGRNERRMKLEWDKRLLSWRNLFLVADRLLKVHDAVPWKPFRRRALGKSLNWLLAHEENSGGLGAIFPAMTHAVMAYKSLGLADAHPAVRRELTALAAFEIETDDAIRVQPCVSPVWDTAIAISALVDSAYAADSDPVMRAARWLLSKQTRSRGDWAVTVTDVGPGGWYFEMENEHYPDVDDTVKVLIALYKAFCPAGAPWTEAPPPVRTAMSHGVNWVFAMQNSDGGWGSFDRNNNRMVFQYVPYADHNAMLDPSSADITARTLEMLSYYAVGRDDPRVRRALGYLYRNQEPDGSWFGRWGVNYLYGTWQTLRGLARIGEDTTVPRIRRAVRWLQNAQNYDGGWGETCASYEPGAAKADGPSTASQTAWALMGLFAAGDIDSPAVRRGLSFLLSRQTDEGTWEEPWFTGTGFPRVFYLRYHLYRHYFPLWALGQYRELTTGGDPRAWPTSRSAVVRVANPGG